MHYLIKNINREYFTAFGTCLILLGMQTGNFIRSLFGVELVNFLMILGLLSLANFKNIFKLKFPLLFGLMNLVFLSQFIILVYAIIAGGSKNEAMNFIFLLYSIAIIFSVSSNDEKVFLKLPDISFYFSSFSVFLGLFILTNGFTGIYLGEDLYYLRMDTEQDGRSMIFLYGSTAIVHLISTCCISKYIGKKGVFVKIFAFLFVVGDMILLIVAGKRTLILASVFVVLYFLWNCRVKINRQVVKIVVLVSSFLMILSVTIDFDALSTVIMGIVDGMSSGLGTLFGMQDAVFDESASVRVGLRKWAIDTIDNDFSLLNYIFGYGYMVKYLDQPILQCYFDMGVLGLFSYFFIMVVLPSRFLINRNNDVFLLYFKLYSIYGIIGCLTSGLPYGYRLYMSSIFLFAAYNAYLRNKKLQSI